LKTEEPATSRLPPAAAISPAFCAVTPPSISMSTARPAIMARSSAIFGSIERMKLWPPKPGFTVITQIRSTMSSTGATALAGVAGLSATPALLPSARIA
jgi:hypothetical protein